MLKQLLYILILTAIAVLFLSQFTMVLHGLGTVQHWILEHLYGLFPRSHTNRLIITTVALTLIPFLIGLIPAFIYWLIEHKEMPKVMIVIWIVWLILLLIFALK